MEVDGYIVSVAEIMILDVIEEVEVEIDGDGELVMELVELTGWMISLATEMVNNLLDEDSQQLVSFNPQQYRLSPVHLQRNM